MNNALGMIETKGLVASIKVADQTIRAANVTLTGQEKVGSGLVTVMTCSDVGAIKAAIDVGVQAAEGVSEVVSSYVIPCLHKEVEKTSPGSNSDAE